MSRSVGRDLAPGETQKIEGIAVLRDWKGGKESSSSCEIVQRDDGDAYVEFQLYERVTRGFTDTRRVPIEGETFLALAAALFAPVESDARIDAVRKAALDSGRYGTCPTCKSDGWKGCAVCHGKGIAPLDRIAAWERDEVASRAGGIAVPWDLSAAEAEEVTLPTLWLGIRAIIDGDGDAPALVNVVAVPKPSGPVKLGVVPMYDAGVEVQTFTMAREAYLSFAAAIASAMASRHEIEATTTGDWITAPQIEAEFDRIPAGWGPVVNPVEHWHGAATPDDEGTPEEERLINVEIQLHGLGWGAGYTPEGDHPDGPTIDLVLDKSGHVGWCGYLPGRPVHGQSAEVGLALTGAVSAIERMLADDAASAAL